MNSYGIVLVVVLIIAAGAMSFQYLKGIGKSFQTDDTSQLNSASLQEQQKQQAQDVEEQRKAYMESIKQKMRDSQRR